MTHWTTPPTRPVPACNPKHLSAALILLQSMLTRILILAGNPHLTWAVAWCSNIWLPYPGTPPFAGLRIPATFTSKSP